MGKGEVRWRPRAMLLTPPPRPPARFWKHSGRVGRLFVFFRRFLSCFP
jgi:hypothetical protein